jgi:predicted secreted protein with PEFG-CTERM motif
LIVKEIYKTSIGKFVDFRIFYSLAILLIISTGTVFAQESLISVQSDDNNYDEGDTIVISGQVITVIFGTPATLQLFSEGNLVDIAQITIAEDGSYSHTVIAEGPLWKKAGDYVIRVSYGEGNIAESNFSYTPKSSVKETTTNFEVDAGSNGTFDVEYTIKGATIKDIVVDSDIFALIVQIESTDDGTITLELPREFIGAEKQDGKDDTFIILIDGIEVAYLESVVHSESRVITINFEEGDSDIEIIGTYVIPEFGAIVMMVLIVGIMITIVVNKNKFQISI